MKKLLFVDDDADFLESNRRYFSRKGYEVFCLSSPKEALSLMASTNLDCIILDIDMPGITGFQICQKLRKHSGTPVICFTIRMALRNVEIIRENRHLNEHLQEEIARKTETLSKLLEERRLLFSGFAHDLKTPITSITTFTRLVELDNEQLDDESRQYLDIIRHKIKEIQEHLSTFNEFAHIDSTPCAFEKMDFGSLLQDFFEQNKPDIDVNGICFELSLPDECPVLIQGDRKKLGRVLQNLVYNAVSFTPEGGTIRLTLTCEKGFAVLEVEDTGSGIAEEELPHIFNRFYTLRSTNDGDGMGLFIVKSIITEHNGTIEVHSAVNKGTVFTVKLPLI